MNNELNAVLGLTKSASPSLSAAATIHNPAPYFQSIPHPHWAHQFCPGCLLPFHLRWSTSVYTSGISSAPIGRLLPTHPPSRPHTAAVWPTCRCVCQVHSDYAQLSRAELELTSRRATWLCARSLLLGSLYCHIMLNGPYKCLVKWLPEPDMPSNKQALLLNCFTCATLPQPPNCKLLKGLRWNISF